MDVQSVARDVGEQLRRVELSRADRICYTKKPAERPFDNLSPVAVESGAWARCTVTRSEAIDVAGDKSEQR